MKEIALVAMTILFALANFTFASAATVHMSDTTATSGLSTYSGRQIHAEYVTGTSSLVGDQIDTITLRLKKTGSPTGTAEIGVFNSDLSVKKLFGTIDVSILGTLYLDYNFSLSSQTYQIQSGDRIGIKFAGGSTSSNVAVMTDQVDTDPFDGQNSYHTYYTTSWQNFPTKDLYMILVKSDPPPVIHMSDTTATSGLSTYSGRQIHAEYVTGTSSLVGDQIDTITLRLKKTGSPTGTAEIGVFNSDLSVKKLFGTISASSLSTAYVDYTFTLPANEQPYQIWTLDRIGIKFTGGSSSSNIGVMIDQNQADPFDGPNSYHTYYTTTWNNSVNNDLYMILKLVRPATSIPDTTPPVITRNGVNPFAVPINTLYVDAGATAFDNINGDLTSSIVSVNPVNTSVLGAYVVTYDVTDSSGNVATQVTRTVNVVDITLPTVSIVAPLQNTLLTGPSTGVVVKVNGTASDSISGINTVEIRTDSSSYQVATPQSAGDWSTWTKTVTFTQEGSHTITARATDNAGNQKWFNAVVTVKFSGPNTVDIFGITKINPTATNGREWFSQWGNGFTRTISSGNSDPYDPEFFSRGTGKTTIDGNGMATIDGSTPRMYVYDSSGIKKWTNVEITFYGKRVSDYPTSSFAGLIAGARSEHQEAEDDECQGRTYYGRMLYDGRINFKKELIHESSYSSNKPSEDIYGGWSTADGTLPKNVWIGYKYVVRTMDDGQHVKMELYRDMSDGANSGSWQKLIEYNDIGIWSETDSGINVYEECGFNAADVILDPHTSVFIRNDGINSAQYKKWSIREIDPLP